MLLRIVAIGFILVGAAIAWEILAATLQIRTNQATSSAQADLGTLWGPPQVQVAPEFWYADKAGRHDVPIDASRLDVSLLLDQRRKGLLWYNTYRVTFNGVYRVISQQRELKFALPFPADEGMYDDVRVDVNNRAVNYAVERGAIAYKLTVKPGQPAEVRVSYSSRGIDQWFYQFGSDSIRAIRNFNLVMHTNFRAIDFPPNSLAPNEESMDANGWRLSWHYRNLLAGYGIGMVFPDRLQPGPLAERLTLWAPLSLLFYFFVLFSVTVVRRINLHPMNYFFLAAAFFSFHLLFAYTVDRVSIGVAFAICSLVSMFLTMSYLRLVVGLRTAALEAGLAQFFYLILFSLALFNEGYSGLTITVGAIVTLFLMMQLTARIDWSERFAAPPAKT